jgi:hypothetical protein
MPFVLKYVSGNCCDYIKYLQTINKILVMSQHPNSRILISNMP